jgi:triphosphatase
MAAARRTEVEMKYEVAVPGGADRYLVAPQLGQFIPDGQVGSIRVEDRYVDSADWALARAGFSARLRKTSRGTQIGLKGQNASAGRLQHREEIEGPADEELVPGGWPASQARTVVLELCGDEPLVEVLTIRQLRRVRSLQAGATRAELSLDDVEVVLQGRVVDKFEELEVELKRGDEKPLAPLVALFDSDGGLRPVSRSKLDRAVKSIRAALPSLPPEIRGRWPGVAPELLAGDPESGSPRSESDAASPAPVATPASAGPRSVGIVADDSLPEAAVKVLRFHFARMKRREAGTRDGVDADALHDMRVATRRMRAAWRVFDGAFKAGKTKKLRRHLETLADRLGTVRDLDVLIEGLEAYRLGLDAAQGPGLEPLHSLWHRQRANARTQLLLELDSSGYETFVTEMEEFLEAGANAAAAVATPTAPHRVRDRAASEIWAAYEVVRAYELVLPWADVETLHELRIATKWLRYALEFFGETLGPDCERLLARVAALQDHLGLLHDADVATKLARDLLVARSGELSKPETEAIGAYLRSREREVARLRRGLGPIWRAVNGAPFRRALGRATAAL